MDTIKKQKKNTKQEFDERVQIVVKEFAEQVGEFRPHHLRYYFSEYSASVVAGLRLVYKSSFESWAGSEKAIHDAGENRARSTG